MQREKVHRLVDTLLDLGQSVLGRQMPAEAAGHFRNARREALLGIRAAVDAALARAQSGGTEPEGGQGVRTIPVE